MYHISMRYLIIVLVISLLTLTIPAVVFAQDSLNSGKLVGLGVSEVVNKDYFAAGKNVSMDGTVNGDAYLAGGDVTLNGTVNGDLLIAGGNLNINGTVTGNIRGAGGNININGKIGKNVSLAGGSIHLSPNANVSGNLTVAGGNINSSGLLKGNINAVVGQLNLASSAKVNGDVTYLSKNKANIAPEASISGTVTQNIPPKRISQNYPRMSPGMGQATTGLFTAFKIFGFFSALVVGFILIRILPQFTNRVSETIRIHWLLAFGIGLLALVITPFLILLLLVTVIGIPLAILWLVFVFFDLWLAKILVSFYLGKFIMERTKQKWNSYLLFTLGLLAYSIVSMIPIIGGLFGFISGLVGFGSIVLTKKNYYQDLSQKKLI